MFRSDRNMNTETIELEIVAPALILTDREVVRLWSKVNKSGPFPDPVKYPNLVGQCWEWIAGRDVYGYGALSFRGKTIKAHRLSWMIQRGQIPGGFCVLHKCDNEPCLNPDHLFLGTKKDNSQDMTRKGRSGAHQHPDTLSRGDSHYSRIEPHRLARGERHGSVTKPETIQRGSTNGGSKLTEIQVIGIRSTFALGNHSYASLAKECGISKTNTRDIILRKRWKHIP